jgi:hypothetical protein
MIRLERETGRPIHPTSGQTPLKIIIVHTSTELTRAAIKKVSQFAGDLAADPVLMAIHIVPYPLTLEKPDVALSHLRIKLGALAQASAMPINVQLLLARDRTAAIRSQLPPAAVIIIATRKSWWRTGDDRLARILQRDGHQVILLRISHPECEQAPE